jgi:hypothetical protein
MDDLVGNCACICIVDRVHNQHRGHSRAILLATTNIPTNLITISMVIVYVEILNFKYQIAGTGYMASYSAI